jgi:NAD+ synthase
MRGVNDGGVLDIDAAAVTESIAEWIRAAVTERFRRKGIVIGLSGGVDSSVVAALCVRALGAGRVLGLLMPEAESSGDSLVLGRLAADSLGMATEVEDVGPLLDASGCYQRRDDAIRTIVPEYGDGCKCKLVLADVLNTAAYQISYLVVEDPDGDQHRYRLTAESYLAIVAANNFKQRARKMLEYYYADRLNYAVAGTPNRLEYDQGFFVKNGDGSADVKPIAHLYKTQVYQLAAYLGIPDEIRHRAPTTDTYSLPQTQEEFYFILPYHKMDLCLWGRDNGIGAEETARLTQLSPAAVEKVYRIIDAKRRATSWLHDPPLLHTPLPRATELSRVPS